MPPASDEQRGEQRQQHRGDGAEDEREDDDRDRDPDQLAHGGRLLLGLVDDLAAAETSRPALLGRCSQTSRGVGRALAEVDGGLVVLDRGEARSGRCARPDPSPRAGRPPRHVRLAADLLRAAAIACGRGPSRAFPSRRRRRAWRCRRTGAGKRCVEEVDRLLGLGPRRTEVVRRRTPPATPASTPSATRTASDDREGALPMRPRRRRRDVPSRWAIEPALHTRRKIATMHSCACCDSPQ